MCFFLSCFEDDGSVMINECLLQLGSLEFVSGVVFKVEFICYLLPNELTNACI